MDGRAAWGRRRGPGERWFLSGEDRRRPPCTHVALGPASSISPCPAAWVTSQTGACSGRRPTHPRQTTAARGCGLGRGLTCLAPTTVDRSLLHVARMVSQASVKTAPGLGVGVQEVAAGGSGTRVLPPHTSPSGWEARAGRGAGAAQAPGAPLFGQFADDSDESAVFVFQPLVVGLQFC